MISIIEALYEKYYKSIYKVEIFNNDTLIGSGTAFTANEGLLTASHCIKGVPENSIIAFKSLSHNTWNISINDLMKRVIAQSDEDNHDYALISLDGCPDGFFSEVINLTSNTLPPVGRQVAYYGYPFGSNVLRYSLGYVSSVEKRNGVDIIGIDGSVNSGNSGGPLIDVETGRLLGIITRSENGLIKDQFDGLMYSFNRNIKLIEDSSASGQIIMLGIDLNNSLLNTTKALQILGLSIRRSANVGIGFAFSTNTLVKILSR